MTTDLAKIVLLLGTTIYFLVFIFGVIRLFSTHRPGTQFNFFAILIGALAQTLGLWLRGWEAGQCPIQNPFEVLQFVSWSMILLYLFTGPVFRLSLFGTATATLAAIISAISFAIPSWDRGRGSWLVGNPWIETHATLALFSYGVFGLLATISVLFILQNYSLKKKQYPAVFRFLPSIVDMEAVMVRLLVFGMAVYTISVLIGFGYWTRTVEDISFSKLAFTVLLWIAYGILTLLRLCRRIHGRTLAWSSILLFVVALLTLWPVELSRSDQSRTASAPPLVLNCCKNG